MRLRNANWWREKSRLRDFPAHHARKLSRLDRVARQSVDEGGSCIEHASGFLVGNEHVLELSVKLLAFRRGLQNLSPGFNAGNERGGEFLIPSRSVHAQGGSQHGPDCSTPGQRQCADDGRAGLYSGIRCKRCVGDRRGDNLNYTGRKRSVSVGADYGNARPTFGANASNDTPNVGMAKRTATMASKANAQRVIVLRFFW